MFGLCSDQGGVSGSLCGCILSKSKFMSVMSCSALNPSSGVAPGCLCKCVFIFVSLLCMCQCAGLCFTDCILVTYWRASFFLLILRGGSSASA